MKNIPPTDGDGLTLDELEVLAAEIHATLTKNKGLTISQFIDVVTTFPIAKLGYRNLKAVCEEGKLEAYFPDEVFDILRDRCKEYFSDNS